MAKGKGGRSWSVSPSAFMEAVEADLVQKQSDMLRESEINQKGKARKLWDIEEGKGI
ncbi:hypothetical protein [Pseudomonas aeruginosa]|uniref:hypothetical protein n=1 Tax=Pseudomonas aeruginosa TaxID=287 RepID=UPI000A5BBE8B|nr:hypothetical protein [Pseudomonas aeruginosa]